MLKPTVSEKNTKKQILDAYNNLLKIIESQRMAMKTPVKSEDKDVQDKPLSFRTRVVSKIDDIEKEVAEKRDEITSLTDKIDILKSELSLAKKFQFSREELRELEEKIVEEKRDWERKKAHLEKEMEEDLAWKKDRLEKELKELKWAFEKEKAEKLLILKEREDEFERKAKDYEELKLKVDELGEIIEKEVEAAEKRMAKMKDEEFANEKKILIQQFEYDKKLLEQKVLDIEARLKQEASENASLKSQLSSLQIHIKDMSVAALEKGKEVEKESEKK